MLKTVRQVWVKPVSGLFTFSSISTGLYSAAHPGQASPVHKLPRFYKLMLMFVPSLFHASKTHFTSVNSVLRPAVHTTYNKRLFYLNLVINSRRFA